jgi:ubiquinone/menaquinone biosynthesis C-methylase UbiE
VAKNTEDNMSTEKIYNATINKIMNHFKEREREFHHLDIGSGSGDLVKLLKKQLNTKSSCCDYTDELIQLPGQKVDIIDLNKIKELPYQDNSFDIITATEVIEHLEDFRKILREMYRVLKPDGICILSTPNILNLNSRLRNLWFGFADLMGPLPINERKIESCAGHINPVSLFYIMHALYESRFRKINFTVDKYQRSGIGKAIILWLPIKLLGIKIWRREVKKNKTIDVSTKYIVSKLNSLPVLLGRTIIVSAIK